MRIRFVSCVQMLLGLLLIGCGPSGTQPTGLTLPPTATVAATIWHPAMQSSWQLQLDDSPLNPTLRVQVYDIDGFDRDAATVAKLHQQGAKVICYLDAGTWENWRSDAGQFPPALIGKAVSGWAGEQWLDIRQLAVLMPLMTTRMQMCKAKGFDAIDPDNINGYTNDTGFHLTANDQLTYDRLLATMAHHLGLSIGLKNDLDQVPDLLPSFDWALNEQCFDYQECDKLLPFIQADKAVFEVEYALAPSQFCPQANALNFNALKKDLSLDAYRVACR